MSDNFQSLYDEYVDKYGPPKEPRNLIAYSKKHGRSIKFSIARELINKNKNNTNTTKKNTDTTQNNTITKKPEHVPVTKNKIDKLHETTINKPAINKQAMNKQFMNNYTDTPSTIQGLDSIIKPLATITPTNVTQKTDLTIMEIDDSNTQQDLQNDINYKNIKQGTFVKKKGTGTTPKALNESNTENNEKDNNAFFNNPWLKNDAKNKQREFKEPEKDTRPKPAPSRPESSPPPPAPNTNSKMRRKLTPIMPLKFKVIPKAKNKPLPTAPMNFNKKPPQVQKYWVKPKPLSDQRKIELKHGGNNNTNNKPLPIGRNQLATAKPLSDHRKIELKENASVQVENIKNISTKDKEKDVLKWINKKMGKVIFKAGIKRTIYVSMCGNGQLLCRILNKVKTNVIDKKIINQKANDNKFDKKRINMFGKVLKDEFGIVCQFKCESLINGKVSVWIGIVNTLYVLMLKDKEILKEKKEKKAQKKEDMTPLGVWCRCNKISKNILNRLKKNKYDLYKLLTLKSDGIEGLCNNLEIKINSEKIAFMKCIIKLKETSDNQLYVVLGDYICNLEKNESFNMKHKSDVKRVLRQIIYDKNDKIFALILDVIGQYRNDNEIVNYLLGFIGRMNVNELDVNKLKIKNKQPVFYELNVDMKDEFGTKCSYHLMEVLTEGMIGSIDDNKDDEFIRINFENIMFNSMCVYVPQSKLGNPYHTRIVCDVLLDKYPMLVYKAILGNKNIEMLLKYACFNCLDHGNFNSFVLELLCFQSMNNGVIELKTEIIKKFIDWKWVDYILSICSNNNKFCSNYSLFIVDLIGRCAYDIESGQLFKNKSSIIISTFINGLLNNKLSKFNRILCSQTLSSIFDIIKAPTLFIDDGNDDSTMPNNLHELFEISVIEIYEKYFNKLCDIIINKNKNQKNNKQIKINNRIILSPFGTIRLHCLEIIGMSVDLSMLNASQPLGIIKIEFWEIFLDLLFIHYDNNLFLNQFRRLIHLSMLFRRRILKHLCLKCNLLSRLIEFYFSNKLRTELHSYIVQMLWNFYSNDQQTQMTTNFSEEDEDKFDIITHFESYNKWNKFIQIIENEMNARIITNMEINTETIHMDLTKDDEIIYKDEKQQESDASDDDSYSSSNSDDSYDNNDNDNKQQGDDDDDDDICELYDVNDFDINSVNWNPFRNDISNKNIMPNIEYLSHFGVFNDYKFNNNNNNKYIPNKNNLFNISYSNANINTNAYIIFKYNINKEIFNKIYFDKCKNRKLNLMIVLDHSMKTKYRFKGEELKSKLGAINDIILNIFTNILSDSDRFGLITFNHEAYLEFDLDFKTTYNIKQLQQCFENIREYGGCDVDGAYYRAIDSYLSIEQDINYENRILFITTKQPSSKDLFPESLLNLVQRYCADKKLNIFTTFISISKQFDYNIIDEINECKGCNYFHIYSQKQFMELSNIFKSIIYPIYFNINISLINNKPPNKSVINNIFGGMMNDNERIYRCKTGIIKTFHTLFINSFDDKYNNYNNIILIQLNENIKTFKVLIQYNENNYNINDNDDEKQLEMNSVINLSSEINPYYDNNDIKKIILLTRYINLLKEWIIQWNETNKDINDRYLSVSDEYKEKFKELSILFQQEDIALQTDLKIVQKLANYDWESAQMIRNLAKYDNNSPHI